MSTQEYRSELVPVAGTSLVHEEVESLVIPDALVTELIAEAQARAPKSSWGVIVGRRLQAERACALDDSAAYCWGMKPEDFERIEQEHLASEKSVLAVYHSHHGANGCPLILDAPQMANWRATLRHVVICIVDGKAPILTVFRKQGDVFVADEARDAISKATKLLARFHPRAEGVSEVTLQQLLPPPALKS